jgi:hypothetical protein
MHPLTGSRLLANDERFRFDATSAVVSTPSPPQGATQVSLRLNGFVAGNRSVARPLPGNACQHAREYPSWSMPVFSPFSVFVDQRVCQNNEFSHDHR